MEKRKSRFAGKVANDAHRQSSAASSYGHLSLPKGISMFKETPGGRAKLDFLPYVVTSDKHMDRNEKVEIAVPGEIWYKAPYKLHRKIGANDDSFVCLTTIGKKCPICEYRAKLTKESDGSQEAKDQIVALRPSLRNLYYVVPIGMKDFEEKPHIWDISQAMFQKLLNTELEEKPENEIFPDLEEGLTLSLRFSSETIGKSKPFAETSRIDFDDRDEAYEDSMLDKLASLDNCFKILSYKELDAIFLELDPEDVHEETKETVREEAPLRKRKKAEEEEEVEEKPARRSRAVVDEDEVEAPVRTRKPAAEVADEDEAPVRRRRPVVEEEEEVEEKPVRTKRAPAPEPVEEEEEEEEEEVKEVAKPVRTRKAPEPEKLAPKGEDNRCPSGFRFGVDTDLKKQCDVCSVWEDCIEEKEKKGKK